jgi:hypothetical protein
MLPENDGEYSIPTSPVGSDTDHTCNQPPPLHELESGFDLEPPQGATSQAFLPVPTVSNNSMPGLGQKQTLEDLSQFAEQAVRNVRLKPEGRKQLLSFVKVSVSSLHLM